MRIVTYYSHLNGLEFLQVHQAPLWAEIQNVITSLDAATCRTKVSKEVRTKDELFYSPVDMNKAMKTSFLHHGWGERRTSYWVAVMRRASFRVLTLPALS